MYRVINLLNGYNGEIIGYTLDKRLSNIISKVNQLYNKVDFSRINTLDNIILDCYASSTIEGAITNIGSIKDGLVYLPTDKGTRMAVNCVNAVKYSLGKPLNEENLLKLWNIIVDGVCENTSVRGTKYRNGMVYVGNHTPAGVESIQGCMDSLFLFIHAWNGDKFLKSAIVHFYFVYVHPFCDGNGRVARLLSNIVIGNNMYKVLVSNTIMNSLSSYYRSIRLSEEVIGNKLDISNFIWYMLNVYKTALNSLLIGKISELETRIYNLMEKHAGAEITIRKLSSLFNISYSKARDTLEIMVERGTLVKCKRGRVCFYSINLLR